MSGKLYLIPTVLSPTPHSQVLPANNAVIIRSLRYFIVEDIRTARRFIRQTDRDLNIDELTFYELNQHTDRTTLSTFLIPLEEGNDIGIISEAGCPAIADPGADIVCLAQAKNYTVVPLVGPSSILMSLMASGFNGQSFAFVGYLPIEKSVRNAKLKQLEKRVYAELQTQIFIETPYRNMQLMNELCSTLQPHTKICVACDITGEGEYIKTYTVNEWKKQKNNIDLHKKPTIFLMYK